MGADTEKRLNDIGQNYFLRGNQKRVALGKTASKYLELDFYFLGKTNITFFV